MLDPADGERGHGERRTRGTRRAHRRGDACGAPPGAAPGPIDLSPSPDGRADGHRGRQPHGPPQRAPRSPIRAGRSTRSSSCCSCAPWSSGGASPPDAAPGAVRSARRLTGRSAARTRTRPPRFARARPDPALHGVDQPTADEQAQAEARVLGGGRGPVEEPEDAVGLARLEARPLVGDLGRSRSRVPAGRSRR